MRGAARALSIVALGALTSTMYYAVSRERLRELGGPFEYFVYLAGLEYLSVSLVALGIKLATTGETRRLAGLLGAATAAFYLASLSTSNLMSSLVALFLVNVAWSFLLAITLPDAYRLVVGGRGGLPRLSAAICAGSVASIALLSLPRGVAFPQHAALASAFLLMGALAPSDAENREYEVRRSGSPLTTPPRAIAASSALSFTLTLWLVDSGELAHYALISRWGPLAVAVAHASALAISLLLQGFLYSRRGGAPAALLISALAVASGAGVGGLILSVSLLGLALQLDALVVSLAKSLGEHRVASVLAANYLAQGLAGLTALALTLLGLPLKPLLLLSYAVLLTTLARLREFERARHSASRASWERGGEILARVAGPGSFLAPSISLSPPPHFDVESLRKPRQRRLTYSMSKACF